MIRRDWVTPISAGAFLLSAVTGVLIFFHIDIGLSKFAHEWLSWVLLGAIVLHVVANLPGFKAHLRSRKGQIFIGVFALVLAAALLVPASGGKGGPPYASSVRALSQTPLSTLAQVARVSPEQLRARLAQAGVQPTSDQQSLNDLVGADMGKQMRTLSVVFAEAK